MWVAATLHPDLWWLVTELNRFHRLFRPALCRRVHEPKTLVDGARLELSSHGCRPCVIPLYEPPTLINPTNKWGDRSESNRLKRVPQTRPAPFGFGHIWSWSSESNTRWRGTSSLHCHCARPANIWSWHAALNCSRALTMRLLFPLSYTSGAGAAIRSPQQAKIRLAGDPDSNVDHGLTMPALFPLSYTSTQHLEVAGRIALPMICFAGRRLAVLATPPQTVKHSGAEYGDLNPCFRPPTPAHAKNACAGDPDCRSGVLPLYELRLQNGASSES